MEFPQKVSANDLATVLGIVPRTVGKLAEKGVLRREGYGVFDLTDAVQAYVAYRESVIAAEHGVGAFGKARAELTLERARLMRIKRQQAEGELLPTKEVIAAGTAVMAVVRNRLLSVAPKFAPQLVMVRSASEVESILRPAIEEALEELAGLEIAPPNERHRRRA
jgi:phage terminase Nu1 subunit (DNA packaging protein)